MAACCGVPRCTCRVTAGPGVTVDGNGSAATPYVVSAASNPTPVQAADTPTVDTTVTGVGTIDAPYVVSADVILDPAPPGGGSNLIGEGPDGLYVECADVRQCFSAGNGAAYDPATGEITARPSTDAGNLVHFGTDGGLLATAPAATPTPVEGGDTNTAHNTVAGTGTTGDPYVVTTDVVVDPTPPAGGTNLLNAGPDGLYVECADVRQCFSAGNGAGYDPATGEITARVSGDAGNTTTIGTDGGLYTPAGTTAVEAADTNTVDVTVTGSGSVADPYQVAAAVILDPAPPGGGSNLIGEGPDGLYVECADVRQCFSAGDGAAYDPATGEITARLSVDAGNTVAFGSDGGLYAAGGGAPSVVEGGNTQTAHDTVSGTGAAGDPYVVTTDVVVAPDPNGLDVTADGLLVAPSSDAGNRLAFGGDGRLFVPPVPPPEVGCGLQGDGTAASPLAANPARGMDPWASHWGCDATQYSTLRCDPDTGFLWTPPEHYTVDDYLNQEHMNPAIASMGPTSGWVALQPGGTVAFVQWSIPANFLGNMCRDWGYNGHVHASVDITANSTATFELGYILQVNGTTVGTRPIEAVYTAYGASRRERYAGSVTHAAYRIPAGTARNVVFFPAVNVLAGNIAINSWISDAALHTATRD